MSLVYVYLVTKLYLKKLSRAKKTDRTHVHVKLGSLEMGIGFQQYSF